MSLVESHHKSLKRSSPQTRNPPILKAVTITLAACGVIRCACTLSRQFHCWFSCLAIKFMHVKLDNVARLPVWTNDNRTGRRGKKFLAFPAMYCKFSYYYWSVPLPCCLGLSRANATLSPSQQSSDLLAPNACGICDLYMLLYTHTEIQYITFPSVATDTPKRPSMNRMPH